MISITTESGAVLTAPDSLEKLSQKELLIILDYQRAILTAVQEKDEDLERRHRLDVIYHLFKINYWGWVDLTESDQNKLILATVWIDKARVQQLPFAYFDFQGIRYFVPKPGYADACAVEVALSNIWYLAFAHPKTPNPEAFFHLLGTLYRPADAQPRKWYQFCNKKPSEARMNYTSEGSEARAQIFKQLPYGLALALLQYWECMNNDFLKRYSDLFDGDEDQAALYQGGEGWIACLEEVGGLGTYGTTEKVFMENVHTIFGFLRRKQIKVRSLEKDKEADD